MTVQDLLRHTSGLTYAHLTGPHLKQAYETASVVDERQTNAEMAEKLAKVPLAYQPGTTFQYGVSTDMLGRVVEVASGMSLDRFIDERICKPLGLLKTSFGPIERFAGGPATNRQRFGKASADARYVRSSELDFGRQRIAVDGKRLCALLPDAAQRRRTRRRAIARAADHRSDDVRSSDTGNAPKPVNSSFVRRACANARAWSRLRPRLCGAHPQRAQSACRVRSAIFRGAASPALISGSIRSRN